MMFIIPIMLVFEKSFYVSWFIRWFNMCFWLACLRVSLFVYIVCPVHKPNFHPTREIKRDRETERERRERERNKRKTKRERERQRERERGRKKETRER